jgi:hypothetical protein
MSNVQDGIRLILMNDERHYHESRAMAQRAWLDAVDDVADTGDVDRTWALLGRAARAAYADALQDYVERLVYGVGGEAHDDGADCSDPYMVREVLGDALATVDWHDLADELYLNECGVMPPRCVLAVVRGSLYAFDDGDTMFCPDGLVPSDCGDGRTVDEYESGIYGVRCLDCGGWHTGASVLDALGAYLESEVARGR